MRVCTFAFYNIAVHSANRQAAYNAMLKISAVIYPEACLLFTLSCYLQYSFSQIFYSLSLLGLLSFYSSSLTVSISHEFLVFCEASQCMSARLSSNTWIFRTLLAHYKYFWRVFHKRNIFRALHTSTSVLSIRYIVFM